MLRRLLLAKYPHACKLCLKMLTLNYLRWDAGMCWFKSFWQIISFLCLIYSYHSYFKSLQFLSTDPKLLRFRSWKNYLLSFETSTQNTRFTTFQFHLLKIWKDTSNWTPPSETWWSPHHEQITCRSSLVVCKHTMSTLFTRHWMTWTSILTSINSIVNQKTFKTMPCKPTWPIWFERSWTPLRSSKAPVVTFPRNVLKHYRFLVRLIPIVLLLKRSNHR